ncbi:hypothetical protein C2G38_2192895 [Gigaspora rosea]|uniref:Uncharacterized protein n=1 Tax=Gigaspora rosea TaxID=44941 RepID=A0A397UYB5_9GLOM|nr:hypothetical protein C2G38_2192895 [Gigaspora rosea]
MLKFANFQCRIIYLYLSSIPNPNNETNSHLINLIKELSSENNQLKSEISEYRDLVSSLQNRIEDLETASVAGYLSHGSCVTSTFQPHDEMGENQPSSVMFMETIGDTSNNIPGTSAQSINAYMSPVLSSSFGPGSYNTFNSLAVDSSVHSPVGSVVSSSMLSNSNPLHHHYHYHHHHYHGENNDIVQGNVFCELEKCYKKPRSKSKSKGHKILYSTRKSKRAIPKFDKKVEDQLNDKILPIPILQKRNTSDRRAMTVRQIDVIIVPIKSATIKKGGMTKQKIFHTSSANNNNSEKRPNVSLLSAGLMRSSLIHASKRLNLAKVSPATTSAQPTQSSPLAVHRRNASGVSTMAIEDPQSSMETWRAYVAQEQQQKSTSVENAGLGNNVKIENQLVANNDNNSAIMKGKIWKDMPNFLIKVFVEEVFAHIQLYINTGVNRSKLELQFSESLQNQNLYQLLFNLASHIMDRMKGTDLMALNHRLKRTFDILKLTNLKELCNNDEMKANPKMTFNNLNSSEHDKSQKELFMFSPEYFLPLVHLLQDLLNEIGKLRIIINDIQISYMQKVEKNCRKDKEEFGTSILSGKDDEQIRRRERAHSQSSDSVDFLHDRDVSVGSIDTFAKDNYYIDRNLESYIRTPNTQRNYKRRESNDSSVGSILRHGVISLFGRLGGSTSGKSNQKIDRTDNLVNIKSGKMKYQHLVATIQPNNITMRDRNFDSNYNESIWDKFFGIK